MEKTIKAILKQKQNIQGCTIQRGAQGEQGEQGEAATIEIGTVTTGAPNTYASVTNSGTSNAAILDFVIPRGAQGEQGEQGAQGEQGDAATIEVGSVTTGNAGTDANVVNSGTQYAAVLDFTIPRGDKGAQGETGNGIVSISKTSSSGLVDTYTVLLTDGHTYQFTVTNGSSIASIELLSTVGLVDTYQITLTNGDTDTFTVTNGYSPTATVTKSGNTSTITITDKNGTTTASVLDGEVNADLSNLSAIGNSKLHALKSYADNGELLTDADGLAFVKKYAHSTFDLSKFTVVGSPTITSDGIASGFSSANSVGFSVTTGNIFTFKERITTSSSVGGAQIFAYVYRKTDTTDRLFDLRLDNGQFFIVHKNSSGSNSIGQNLKTAVANTTYDIKIVINNGTITWYVDDEQIYTTDTLYVDGISKIETAPNGSIATFTGSIDLKQFSITADGVEIFNGNKTGIDTIKPDNYTVVGTPTISADGILTGSSTNAISFTNIDFASATTFDIYGRFNCNNTTVNSQYLFTPTSGFGFSLYINGTTLSTNISSNGTSFNIALYGSIKTITQGRTYDYHINYDGTKYNFYAKEASSKVWVLERTYTGGISPALLSSVIYAVGGLSTNDRNINGTTDLNCFKVYLDGSLVYQPCLKIPYTESKTGSKIVDSIYRDRVNDMAEQFGYANYYTLSDTDFTLPQVELYGLIGAKTLRDSYENGINKWYLYSNRDLEQQGSCTSGVEVTLAKPFADTNYILTVPYSAKSTTAFTPTQTGDWIAKGKGLL